MRSRPPGHGRRRGRRVSGHRKLLAPVLCVLTLAGCFSGGLDPNDLDVYYTPELIPPMTEEVERYLNWPGHNNRSVTQNRRYMSELDREAICDHLREWTVGNGAFKETTDSTLDICRFRGTYTNDDKLIYQTLRVSRIQRTDDLEIHTVDDPTRY